MTMITRTTLLTIALLIVSNVTLAQSEWDFHPPSDEILFGPVLTNFTSAAELYVACQRFSQDIKPDPVHGMRKPLLMPRRLEVNINWLPTFLPPSGHLVGNEPIIVGSSKDLMIGYPARISFRIDDGELVTQEWDTWTGLWYIVRGNEAIQFLQKLLHGDQLTISSDFTDETTREATFELDGTGEALAQMVPQCAALEGLEMSGEGG